MATPEETKRMSVDELLKPRYKAIAEDLSGIIKVGDIYMLCSKYGDEYGITVDYPLVWTESYFKKYPHLFKSLAWYEEISESELLLVKYGKFNADGQCFKIEGAAKHLLFYQFVPITETEYLNYIKQKSHE